MRFCRLVGDFFKERWPFLIVCLFITLFSLPVGISSDASAILPRSLYRKYSDASINNYDPCDGVEDDGSERKCVIPSGDQITWIGDSYSVGAQPIIESEFPGISFGDGEVGTAESQIQVSKTVSGENPSNPSGFTILKEIIDDGKLKPYLVFALGTNGGWGSNEVKEFKRIMSDYGDTKVVFVNSKIPGNDYAASNKELKGLVDSSENYYLADWAAVAKDEWFESDPGKIHPYDGDGFTTWVKLIKDALPMNCTAGLVPEDTNEGMVWNYFVRANIDGVSDNPAVIAGIMGNLKEESGFIPFAVSPKGYYGIHQTQDAGFKKVVDDAGLGQYWGNWSGASADEVKKAIQLELDWVIRNNPRWAGGAGWSADNAFVPNLKNVDDVNSPESYADLFMVTVEGCYPGGSDVVEDSKVRAIADRNGWTGNAWQVAEQRRNSAKDIYDRLASSGSLPSESSSNFSSTESLSGSGNVKYAIDDEELNALLRFAIYEEGKTGKNYTDILSGILDDFEKSESGSKGDGDKLMEYVGDVSGKFVYKNDYQDYLKNSEARNLEINSSQLEKAKAIVIDGLRTTSAAQSQIVKNKNSSICPTKKKKKGIGAARIAEVAALMSWPVQSWQTNADDFATDRVGKCDGGSGWVSYVHDTPPCMTNPRVLYKNNLNPSYGIYGYLDCGTFVSSVLSYLDLIDDTIRGDGQPGYGKNLRASSDWEEIPNEGVSSMKPGDILWNGDPGEGGNGMDGHIMIFLGEKYGGEYGNVAAASAGTRVGEVQNIYNDNYWYIFRYVGDKLGGDGEGLTEEEANKLANNYNTNKGNWSGYPNNIKVAGFGNYCHSDALNTCASDYSNCSLFSGFFAEMFWGAEQRTWPSGSGVVDTLRNLGYSTGNEPRPFAIFSTTSFHGNNHTGVVVAVDGNKIATVEAGYPNMNARYFDFEDISGQSIEFAYPDEVDYDKLMEFIKK